MAPNSILMSAIDSASKKPIKRHITCPNGDLVEVLCFQGTTGHFEFIWRSFGGRVTFNAYSSLKYLFLKKSAFYLKSQFKEQNTLYKTCFTQARKSPHPLFNQAISIRYEVNKIQSLEELQNSYSVQNF